MKSHQTLSTFLLSLGGLLALGLVACQNAESLAGQDSASALASAKSKFSDSIQTDSLGCGTRIPFALAKHGADDSIPEIHHSEDLGCDDRSQVKEDGSEKGNLNQGHGSENEGPENDSLPGHT